MQRLPLEINTSITERSCKTVERQTANIERQKYYTFNSELIHKKPPCKNFLKMASCRDFNKATVTRSVNTPVLGLPQNWKVGQVMLHCKVGYLLIYFGDKSVIIVFVSRQHLCMPWRWKIFFPHHFQSCLKSRLFKKSLRLFFEIENGKHSDLWLAVRYGCGQQHYTSMSL